MVVPGMRLHTRTRRPASAWGGTRNRDGHRSRSGIRCRLLEHRRVDLTPFGHSRHTEAGVDVGPDTFLPLSATDQEGPHTSRWEPSSFEWVVSWLQVVDRPYSSASPCIRLDTCRPESPHLDNLTPMSAMLLTYSGSQCAIELQQPICDLNVGWVVGL